MSERSDGMKTVESSPAYCAPARKISSRVEGRLSAGVITDICSGMRRRNKYQVTTMTVTTIGAVQATKIPWLNEMRMHAGSNASLATEYAMFSMATHREALRPIMTESCNAK